MKYFYQVPIFVSLIAVAMCGDQIYVNKLFDSQLKTIGNALKKVHVKYIQLGDVDVSDDIKATNVRLGDISNIVRKGDATFWTDEDTMSNQGAVGIDKMDLLMDTLQLNGKTYNKVLVVVYSNMLSFKSDLYSTKTECNQTYSQLKLSHVQGVMLYSRPSLKMNVTSQFIKEVVPFVNHKLSSPSILRIILKYMDSCAVHSVHDMVLNLAEDSDSLSTEESLEDDTNEVIDDNLEDNLTTMLRKIIKSTDFKVAYSVQVV